MFRPVDCSSIADYPIPVLCGILGNWSVGVISLLLALGSADRWCVLVREHAQEVGVAGTARELGGKKQKRRRVTLPQVEGEQGMMWSRRLVWAQGSLLCCLLIGWLAASAEPPAEEVNRKPSSYAPAKDLEYQVSFFLDRIKEDLENEAQYDTHAKRVVKDANTIAVLALVLGKHDDDNRFKRPATAVIKAATSLADKAEKLDEAKVAYQKLLDATKSPGGGATLPWKSVGNIQEIMLQVPLLNTSLRGAVRSKRFNTTPEKAAGLAAGLAAIAQVSMFDETYCGDAADREEWVELCGLMRDAAKDVHAAVQRGDQAAAIAALKPLVRSCDECHDEFRD